MRQACQIMAMHNGTWAKGAERERERERDRERETERRER